MNHVTDHVLKKLGTLITKGIEFHPAALDVMTRPCVYLACGAKGVLYVGMSRNGIGRATDPKHHRLTGLKRQITSLKVYPCQSEEGAREAEKLLIALFQPPHNRRLGSAVRNALLGNR